MPNQTSLLSYFSHHSPSSHPYANQLHTQMLCVCEEIKACNNKCSFTARLDFFADENKVEEFWELYNATPIT